MRGWILIVPFATSCAAPPASMDAALRTDAVADAASDPCEPFGRFGAPLETFTLPGPDGVGAMYIPDVQARFPAVRWSTLDRLYVPAGTYALINLGNLPVRTAEHPLVITNHGGQVVLRPPAGSHYGYLWVLNGGAHWVATGRFDPVSGTGDAAFPGHRCGAYANSRGTYGFLSDDAFLNAGHMGLAIGDARFVEAEFIEITRAGFAGLRVLSSVQADGTRPTLDGYDLHDLYIHDTKSEGVYFGWTGAPPSPLSSGLRVHHNRFVRTGAEALQVQNLGDGTEIHHNAVAFAAVSAPRPRARPRGRRHAGRAPRRRGVRRPRRSLRHERWTRARWPTAHDRGAVRPDARGPRRDLGRVPRRGPCRRCGSASSAPSVAPRSADDPRRATGCVSARTSSSGKSRVTARRISSTSAIDAAFPRSVRSRILGTSWGRQGGGVAAGGGGGPAHMGPHIRENGGPSSGPRRALGGRRFRAPPPPLCRSR